VQRVPFWVELPGKEAVKIRAGEGYVLPPNVPYGYSIRTATPARFSWVHINYHVFDSLNLFHLLKCPIRYPAETGRAFAAINRQLHALGNDQSLSLKAIAEKKVLGYRLLVLLLNSATRSFNHVEDLTSIQRLLPVLTFIKNHLADQMTRKGLADRVLLSETHFHTCFKRVMGLAPMEYVQRQRMQKAQQLLVQTRESIADVAGQVGFDDQFYFSRQFRAAFAMSPTEYRKRREQMFWQPRSIR
jgi:AraC family transcriptional regulator of arabinose operon